MPKLRSELTDDELPAKHLITSKGVLKPEILLEALKTVLQEAKDRGEPIVNNTPLYDAAVEYLRTKHDLTEAYVNSETKTARCALRTDLAGMLSDCTRVKGVNGSSSTGPHTHLGLFRGLWPPSDAQEKDWRDDAIARIKQAREALDEAEAAIRAAP